MSPLPISRTPKRARDAGRAGTVAGQLGREYDLVIGGERIKTEGKDPLAESRRGPRRSSAFIRKPGPSTPSRPWPRRSRL